MRKNFKTCLPAGFAELPEDSKAEYMCLRKQFSHEAKTMSKPQTISILPILERVKSFAQKGDHLDVQRCQVSGMMVSDGYILLNVSQLQMLIQRGKSWINASMARAGYWQHSNRTESINIIKKCIPPIASIPSLIRQWSVREHREQKSDDCPTPSEETQSGSSDSPSDEDGNDREENSKTQGAPQKTQLRLSLPPGFVNRSPLPLESFNQGC